MTSLGSVLVIWLVTLAGSLCLALMRRPRPLVLLLVAVAGGQAVSSGLKLLVGRTRPDVVPNAPNVFTASFPSGHALLSAVLPPDPGRPAVRARDPPVAARLLHDERRLSECRDRDQPYRARRALAHGRDCRLVVRRSVGLVLHWRGSAIASATRQRSQTGWRQREGHGRGHGLRRTRRHVRQQRPLSKRPAVSHPAIVAEAVAVITGGASGDWPCCGTPLPRSWPEGLHRRSRR